MFSVAEPMNISKSDKHFDSTLRFFAQVFAQHEDFQQVSGVVWKSFKLLSSFGIDIAQK